MLPGILRPVSRLTILVTAAGAPGAAALLRALRENGEREVRLVCCDVNPRSIGRFHGDAFHTVPPGPDPEFVPMRWVRASMT